MNPSSNETYLAAQVMTASPQRLRLLLIEGAIRFARQAADAWTNHQYEAAGQSIDRCRGILTELLASPQSDRLPRLTSAVVDLYRFLFETLNAASLAHDSEKLNDVVRLLEIERETWRQVCQQLAEASPPGPPISGPHLGRTFSPRSMPNIAETAGGFSAEA